MVEASFFRQRASFCYGALEIAELLEIAESSADLELTTNGESGHRGIGSSGQLNDRGNWLDDPMNR
jgi:hypothetical protein